MDKLKIQQEAKKLLDKFAESLEKIEKEHAQDFYVDRKDFERQETILKKPDLDFKKRILENAPNSDDDFIIAEKGAWKNDFTKIKTN